MFKFKVYFLGIATVFQSSFSEFVNKLLLANAGGVVICLNLITTENQSPDIKLIASSAFEFFLFGLGAAMLCAIAGHANALFRSLYPSKTDLKKMYQQVAYYGLDGLTGFFLGASGILFLMALIVAYEFIK